MSSTAIFLYRLIKFRKQKQLFFIRATNSTRTKRGAIIIKSYAIFNKNALRKSLSFFNNKVGIATVCHFDKYMTLIICIKIITVDNANRVVKS